jgi:hypothetical protein
MIKTKQNKTKNLKEWKLRIKGNFFNILETLYEKLTANIIPDGERLKALPL